MLLEIYDLLLGVNLDLLLRIITCWLILFTQKMMMKPPSESKNWNVSAFTCVS